MPRTEQAGGATVNEIFRTQLHTQLSESMTKLYVNTDTDDDVKEIIEHDALKVTLKREVRDGKVYGSWDMFLSGERVGGQERQRVSSGDEITTMLEMMFTMLQLYVGKRHAKIPHSG